MAETPQTAGGAPAALAKGALRRLAAAKLEPTPANFARAYAEEAGEPPSRNEPLPARARPLVERLAARATDDPALRTDLATALLEGRYDDLQRALDRGADGAAAQAQAWASLIERLSRALDRGNRQWTPGRKKESLQRVLDGSRSDAQRLQQRLRQLISAWEEGSEDPGAPVDEHPRIAGSLQQALRAGLPPDEPRAVELADELAVLADRIHDEGATVDLAQQVAAVCGRAERLFAHRHQLVDELMQLCRSLGDGLIELAEDGSWAQGQGASLRARLDDTASVRAVKAARELLDHTRQRQRELRVERDRARDALKTMIQHMLVELGELGDVTGRFNDRIARYAGVIEAADTLDSLAGVVREMVGDTRTVHEVVAGTRERLAAEHARAGELESRVRELEGELRRLSDEVSTDVLTQVANRRGMATAFEAERARVERDGATLAVGLIDIDNFKKLNDTLGHAAGDVALKSLAARVKEWLRPVDHIARFGGEEFVVLLPATPPDEAQQVLTRLQRRLTASLFMHDGREVFVTFSAGVTGYRPGETLDLALERADEALYEAKRTGKNRTCIA
ncbi:diguanylate cyclase [Ideonella sp. A 288]|uniref:GGDEF domain-containing protein n=1 Tax=Ideonella sp. A 288 TaxID=1962181 RepID=UPI000B4BEA33|nr:GGDEF domain-containing protein [Ideonella sp. A 288]